MLHLGLDLSRPDTRLAVSSKGGTSRRGLTAASDEATRLFAALHAVHYPVATADLARLFGELRRQFPDAVSVVATTASFVPVTVTDAIEESARSAGFRAAQTLAAPTAGAIAYAAELDGAKHELFAVACATAKSIDIGVFWLDGVRVLPLKLSGRICRQLDLDAIEASWRDCEAALVERGESLRRWIGHGSRAPLEHVERLVECAPLTWEREADAIAFGALRCAELLQWNEVIPIHETDV